MELAPESPVAQQYYAATLVLQERFAEALPLLQRSAEDHARQDPNLYYTIALCHLRLGQWDQAVSGFRKVIELTPDHPHAYLCLGMAEVEQGKLAEAEADMREAIQLRPRVSVQYQGYHSTLGTLLERKGDLRGALVEYDAESRENQDAVWVLDRMVAVRAKLASPVN